MYYNALLDALDCHRFILILFLVPIKIFTHKYILLNSPNNYLLFPYCPALECNVIR